MKWLYQEAAQLIFCFFARLNTQRRLRKRSSEQIVRPKHSSVHGVSWIRDKLRVVVSGHGGLRGF